MPNDDFDLRSQASWEAAIDTILPPGMDRAEWNDGGAIARAIQPILGRNNNHALLPTGGGQDIGTVALSSYEPGCLELGVEGGATYLVKPSKLIAQRIPAAAGNSFLLLELNLLEPTDVYDDVEDEFGGSRRSRIVNRGQEEVLELTPGEYADRDIWDRGYVDLDESGNEISLPEDSRVVVRWLRGKIMFVAKASMWNRHAPTYDGRHARMTSDQIREIIERSLAAAEA